MLKQFHLRNFLIANFVCSSLLTDKWHYLRIVNTERRFCPHVVFGWNGKDKEDPRNNYLNNQVIHHYFPTDWNSLELKAKCSYPVRATNLPLITVLTLTSSGVARIFGSRND
jgi:hypothetical protein